MPKNTDLIQSRIKLERERVERLHTEVTAITDQIATALAEGAPTDDLDRAYQESQGQLIRAEATLPKLEQKLLDAQKQDEIEGMRFHLAARRETILKRREVEASIEKLQKKLRPLEAALRELEESLEASRSNINHGDFRLRSVFGFTTQEIAALHNEYSPDVDSEVLA